MRKVNKLILITILISLTACDALFNPKLPDMKRAAKPNDSITGVSVEWTRDANQQPKTPLTQVISRAVYLYKIDLADEDALDVTLTFTTASGNLQLPYQIQDMGDYRVGSEHEINTPFGISDEMAITTDGKITFDISFRHRVYVYVFITSTTPYIIAIEKPAPDRVIYVSESTGTDYDPTVTRGYLQATAFKTFSAAFARAMRTEIKDIYIMDMLTGDSISDPTSLFTISTTNDRLLRIHGMANSTESMSLLGSDASVEVAIPGAGFSAKEINDRLTGGGSSPNVQTKRVFHITGIGTRVVFDNIAIVGGGGVKTEYGGGILIDGGAEVILYGGTVITRNSAVRGGGVSLNAGSVFKAQDCTVYFNKTPNADGEGSDDVYHYGELFTIHGNANFGKVHLPKDKLITVPEEASIIERPTIIALTLERTSYFNATKVLDFIGPTNVRIEGRFTIPSSDSKTQWSIEGGGYLFQSSAYFVGAGTNGYEGDDSLPTHGFKKTLPFASLERAIFAVMTNEGGRGWDTIVINGEIDGSYHAVSGKIDKSGPDDDVNNIWDIRTIPKSYNSYLEYEGAVAVGQSLRDEYDAAAAQSVFTVIMKSPVYADKAADERGIVFLGLGNSGDMAKIKGSATKRVFYVGGKSVLTFDNLEICNGNASASDGQGGAFYVCGEKETDVTVTGTTIHSNAAALSGGAVHVAGSASFHLVGGAVIKVNHATLGGGVSVSGNGTFRTNHIRSEVYDGAYVTATGQIRIEKGNFYDNVISHGEGESNINEDAIPPLWKRPNVVISSMGSILGTFEMQSGYAFVTATIHTLDISGGTVETSSDTLEITNEIKISLSGKFFQKHKLQLVRSGGLRKVIKMEGGEFHNKDRITNADVYLVGTGTDATHKPQFHQEAEVQGDVYLAQYSDYHISSPDAKLDKSRFYMYLDHSNTPYVTLDGNMPEVPPSMPSSTVYGANLRLWDFAATGSGAVPGKEVAFASPTHRGRRLLNIEAWNRLTDLDGGSTDNDFAIQDKPGLVAKYFPVNEKKFELDDDGFLTSWIEAGEKVLYTLSAYDDPTYLNQNRKIKLPAGAGFYFDANYGYYIVFDAVAGTGSLGNIKIAQPKDYYSDGTASCGCGCAHKASQCSGDCKSVGSGCTSVGAVTNLKENYSWYDANAVTFGDMDSRYDSWKLSSVTEKQWDMLDSLTLYSLKDKGTTGVDRFKTQYLDDYGHGGSLKPDVEPNPTISSSNIGEKYMYWTSDPGRGMIINTLYMAMMQNPGGGPKTSGGAWTWWTPQDWTSFSTDLPDNRDLEHLKLPLPVDWDNYYTVLASGHYWGLNQSGGLAVVHTKESSYAKRDMLTQAADASDSNNPKAAQKGRVRFVKQFKNRRVRDLREFGGFTTP